MCFCGLFSNCCNSNADDNSSSELNYSQVIGSSDGCYSSDNRYFSDSDDKAIHLRFMTEDESPPTYGLSVGWKLHIGIYYEDIPRAWNIIKDILMCHQIFHAKCMLENTAYQAQTEETGGQGREITIYAFNEPSNRNDWRELVEKIQDALARKDIRGVSPSPACKPFPRYQYISYRCDQGEDDSKYLKHGDAIAIAAAKEEEEEESYAYNPYNRHLPAFLYNLLNTSSLKGLSMSK